MTGGFGTEFIKYPLYPPPFRNIYKKQLYQILLRKKYCYIRYSFSTYIIVLSLVFLWGGGGEVKYSEDTSYNYNQLKYKCTIILMWKPDSHLITLYFSILSLKQIQW